MEIIQTIGRLAATQGVWDLKARPQLTEPVIRGKFFVNSLQAITVMATRTAFLRCLVCLAEWFPFSPAARLR